MAKVTIQNESGKRTGLEPLRKAIEQALREHGRPEAVVDVVVTTSAVLRTLNRDHRGVDATTDVLTFPGPSWEGAPLGDMAVSIEFAEDGARARNVAVSEELAYLGIHGVLHLLGFEDESESERTAMVTEMNRIAQLVGMQPDPDWASQPH